jgi:nitrite reductase (cytochrome c-552)
MSAEPQTNNITPPPAGKQPIWRSVTVLGGVFVAAVVATLVITYVLVTMFEHKQEARSPYLRIVELNETSVDPELWGQNWPNHFEQYKMTAGDKFYGGSSAMAQSKLETHPWLKRLYAGYAFSIDYREARGHAYMLYDQVVTERVNKKPQAGACLHCHGSMSVLYRKVGLEAMGQPADDVTLAANFNMPAVIKGFQELSQKPYHEVLEMLTQVPDGSGDSETFPSPPVGGFHPDKVPEGHFAMSEAHPVSCIDCHDPSTMKLRVTRPGFVIGIAALANSDEPVPHLPSLEKWRRGDKKEPYDPNALATRQEMRSFACGQCHVEYYCANKDTLTFPWGEGLKVEQIESVWENKKFPDGSSFMDYKHGETGAPMFKAQHPEFELWSQGIHARAGVSCADCHMPYQRTGAMKLSNHNVASPMTHVNNSCQICHNVPEGELENRVKTIQARTTVLMDRTAIAMTEMLDAIMEAKASGITDEQLAEVFKLQRKAMWRLDFISSENSKGFHADQESARILGESIDFSRQAEAMALRLRAPEAPSTSDLPITPATGVSEKR